MQNCSAACRVLVDLPKLTDLDLSEVDRVTDESLVTIGNISGLTRFCLNGCRAITSDGAPFAPAAVILKFKT